jgi:hypothetical protein
MLLNLSAAVLGGYLLSFATKRAHIPHRDVKLRYLLGRQYLLPGLNPRHLARFFNESVCTECGLGTVLMRYRLVAKCWHRASYLSAARE